MQPFFSVVVPYLSDPLFQVVFSGVAASLAHTFLKDHGLTFTKGRTFAFNAFFSAAPFIVLIAQWGTKGVPAPNMFFVELLACLGASQVTFYALKKREDDGSIDTIQIPVLPQGDAPSDPTVAPVPANQTAASATTPTPTDVVVPPADI